MVFAIVFIAPYRLHNEKRGTATR